jgi:nucleoside-diphosphate-sugar epimerase
LAGIHNQRSLIFLDNLVDLAAHACTDHRAAGRVLLARDTLDLSTPELIRALAEGLGRTPRLFAAPDPAFAALRTLPGLGPLVKRLTLSLEVDDQATRALLDWLPPVTSEIGLAATAQAFRVRS